MYRTLLLFVSLYIFSLNAHCQQVPPVADTLLVEDDRTFVKVDVEASFPGGGDAWRGYLMKNLHANVPIKNKAPEGKYMVIVRFIVAKDGSISNALAETNHGYGMEKEVLRIIKRGPRWIPASQDGRLVNAYRRQPVTFVVSGK